MKADNALMPSVELSKDEMHSPKPEFLNLQRFFRVLEAYAVKRVNKKRSN